MVNNKTLAAARITAQMRILRDNCAVIHCHYNYHDRAARDSMAHMKFDINENCNHTTSSFLDSLGYPKTVPCGRQLDMFFCGLVDPLVKWGLIGETDTDCPHRAFYLLIDNGFKVKWWFLLSVCIILIRS